MPKLQLFYSPKLPNFKEDFYQLVKKAKVRMAPHVAIKLNTAHVAKVALEFYLEHTPEPTHEGSKKGLVEISKRRFIKKAVPRATPQDEKQQPLAKPSEEPKPEAAEPEPEEDFATELSRIVELASLELADGWEGAELQEPRVDLTADSPDVAGHTDVSTADISMGDSGGPLDDGNGDDDDGNGGDDDAGGRTEDYEGTFRSFDDDDDDEGGETEKEPFMVMRKLEEAYQVSPSRFLGEKFFKTSLGVGDYVCEICGFSRHQAWGQFNQHIATHTPRSEFRRQCEICSARFRTTIILKRHREEVHNTGATHTCDQCDKTFSNRRRLLRHMFVHSGLRPFVCVICGASFNQKSNLATHKRSHTRNHEALKEWFQCPHCDVRCGNKRGLETHLKSHVL